MDPVLSIKKQANGSTFKILQQLQGKKSASNEPILEPIQVVQPALHRNMKAQMKFLGTSLAPRFKKKLKRNYKILVRFRKKAKSLAKKKKARKQDAFKFKSSNQSFFQPKLKPATLSPKSPSPHPKIGLLRPQ